MYALAAAKGIFSLVITAVFVIAFGIKAGWTYTVLFIYLFIHTS